MRILIVLFAVMVLAACGTPSVSRDDRGSRDREVAEATKAWVAAYDSRDPSRITSLYDPDAVFWGTTSATLRATPAAIAEYFKDVGKRPDARVTVSEQHIRVFGEIAVNSGAYTFTDIRDGKSVANPARFTFVYRNKNGQWLIVDHHSSRVPAP